MVLLEGATLHNAERVQKTYEEHLDIIHHIGAQNGTEANNAVRNHISHSQRVQIRMFR